MGIDEHTRYAVRRRWPNGVHDFIRLSESPKVAQDSIESDRRYWRKGPWRPADYRVVAISKRDFDLHRQRRGCQSPSCP